MLKKRSRLRFNKLYVVCSVFCLESFQDNKTELGESKETHCISVRLFRAKPETTLVLCGKRSLVMINGHYAGSTVASCSEITTCNFFRNTLSETFPLAIESFKSVCKV